jgi:hypothetical protein
MTVMSWIERHKESEILAIEAHEAKKANNFSVAEKLFREAGFAEKEALLLIDPKAKPRTYAVTAISAASLFYKARDFKQAEQVAYSSLSNEALPSFAACELRDLLQAIWNEQAQAEAGIKFVPGQVSVTVDGGEIVRGGAPLDLILEKVQIVQSIFIRTTEFLKDIPLRTRGAPSKEILNICRPWLFQGVPGSYQFIVAIEGPIQLELLGEEPIQPELIASTFMSILRNAVEEPEDALVEAVPDPGYRNTFLKLARNLAPSGDRFQNMQIRAVGSEKPLLITPYTRKELASTLKKLRPTSLSGEEEEQDLRGILRAVHLDNDWLEILTNNSLIKIMGVGEAVNDLIGPMVNHEVIVHAAKGSRGTLRFVDIEPC